MHHGCVNMFIFYDLDCFSALYCFVQKIKFYVEILDVAPCTLTFNMQQLDTVRSLRRRIANDLTRDRKTLRLYKAGIGYLRMQQTIGSCVSRHSHLYCLIIPIQEETADGEY